MKTVYLGLGSNVGDREGHLRSALDRLEAAEIHVTGRSSIYETEPQELPDQPWFLNMVVEAQTELFPLQMLARVQGVEGELGRQRLTPKGPRTIDIDILFYGRAIIHTQELEVPHPALAGRRFVLEPLSELAPDLRHPVNGKSVRELLTELRGQQVRRVDISL